MSRIVWRRILISMILLSFIFVIPACGGDDEVVDGDTDGDTDGDQELASFEYASCASRSDAFQYPTPSWENSADTLTGVQLKPPANDKAALLLKDEKEEWYLAINDLDGFPRMADWVIALDNDASAVDGEKVKVFSWLSQDVTLLSDVDISVELSDDPSLLMIQANKPLPLPQKGERYILALYEGVTTGATPLPACDSSEVHPQYVDAANALVAAGEGEALVYALPTTVSRTSIVHANLYDELSQTPTLQVTSIEEHSDYDNFDGLKADADTLALLAEHSYSGLFTTPMYQDENGIIQTDIETETPIAAGTTSPGYFLILPKDGQAPFPMLLFQHGGSRFKYDSLAIAKPYLENGIAILGIDLPYHGDRASGSNNGSELDMANFDEPLRTRDNFRQASSDHLSVLTGIDALNTALEQYTGETETLDKTRLFFMGHSMGSVSGTMTSSVADNVLGASLVAGGCPYRLVVSDGMFSMFIMNMVKNRPNAEIRLLLGFIQTLLDGGDPVNFPQSQENPELAPKDILIWEAVGEPVLINPATDLQAYVYGADLATPVHHSVEHLSELDEPISNNFDGLGEGSATRVLRQVEFPDVATQNLHMEMFTDMISHVHAGPCFGARAEGNACSY